MIEAESPENNDACMALVSIAQRAAGYEPVLRRSQLYKRCFFTDSTNPMPTRTPSSSVTTYIVC